VCSFLIGFHAIPTLLWVDLVVPAIGSSFKELTIYCS
jgi:hypothetical protein